MQIRRVLPLLGTLLAFSGCQSQEPAEGPMQLASSSSLEYAEAAEKLATARCLGAERCEDIQLDSPLRDFSHCLKVMRNEAEREVSFCRAGIDSVAFQKCSDSWATRDCKDPLTPLSERPECKTEQICRK